MMNTYKLLSKLLLKGLKTRYQHKNDLRRPLAIRPIKYLFVSDQRKKHILDLTGQHYYFTD